jgi:hypothetical protein
VPWRWFLFFLGTGRSRLDGVGGSAKSVLNKERGGPRDSISPSPPNPAFSCCDLLWF